MKQGIGHTIAAAAARRAVLRSIAIGVLATIPVAAAEEGPAPEASDAELPFTFRDQIRAMGLSGALLLSLLLLAIAAIVVNVVQLRRFVRHVPPRGASPADISATTRGFLIAPGVLIGIGALALLVGALGTLASLSHAYWIIANVQIAPTPDRYSEALWQSLLPVRYGSVIGTVAIGWGLVFCGLVGIRRARLVRDASRS